MRHSVHRSPPSIQREFSIIRPVNRCFMHWQSNNAYINQHDGAQPHKTAQNYIKGREQENIVLPFPLWSCMWTSKSVTVIVYLIIETDIPRCRKMAWWQQRENDALWAQMVLLRFNDTNRQTLSPRDRQAPNHKWPAEIKQHGHFGTVLQLWIILYKNIK